MVPSLDDLAGDPGQVASLPREIVAVIYGPVSVLEAQLRARLLVEPVGVTLKADAPDEWIGPEEVTKRFGIDAGWLRRHRRLLRSRKILSTPSRKLSLFHAKRLARLLDDRTGLDRQKQSR